MAEDASVEISIEASQKTGAIDAAAVSVDNLTKSLVGLASAAAIGDFFKEAVQEAVKESEALRQLQFSVEATGGSWEKLKDQVEAYGAAQQRNTRFDDTTTFEVLGRMNRVTGDLGNAMRATTLAQNIAVGSSMELSAATDLVSNLMAGQERAVLLASKQLGAFTDGATTAQGVLNALQSNFEATAEAEDSFTKSTNLAKAMLGDFMQRIGDGVLPPLKAILGIFETLIKWTEVFAEGIAGAMATATTAITGFWNIFRSASHGTIDDTKKAMADLSRDLTNIAENWSASVLAIEAKYSKDSIRIDNETKTIKANNSAQEAEEAKIAAERKIALENTMSAELQQVSNNTFENQRLALVKEIEAADAAEIDKITVYKEGAEQKITLAEYTAQRLNIINQNQALAEAEEAKKKKETREKEEKAVVEADERKKKQFQSTLAFIGSLQTSENKRLASIGKLAASANVIINTAEGVSKAWALGPLLGPVLAPLVAIAGAAQLATIAGVQLKEGGVTDGTGQGGIAATIGEGGRSEAVIPLEDPRALQAVGEAIARAGGLAGGGGGKVVQTFHNTFMIPGLEAAKDPETLRIILEELGNQIEAGLSPESRRFSQAVQQTAERMAGRSF